MRLLTPLILWALLCPLLSHAANLVSVEGSYFEVVGIDHRSVSYVGELAEHIATQSNRYLPDNGVSFPRRILIALRPEANVAFEGQSKLSLSPQGGVRLDFRWDEALTLEQTCFAITQAFLTRYAIFQYGPTAPERMKAWPVQALALESLYAIRSTMLISHLKAAKHAEFIESNTLMTEPLTASIDANFSHHAYFFLSALRKSLFDRDTIRSIIESAIAGGDPSEGIAKLVLVPAAPKTVIVPASPEEGRGAAVSEEGLVPALREEVVTPASPEEVMTLGMWWRAQRDELVSVDYELFETMADSRGWMEQMVNFDVYREAGGALKNIRSLWDQRDDEQIRSILKARVELISLRLEIVNPLYFNATRSLGALYEIALDPDAASYQFMHALVAYLGDLEDAKQIEETTREILDKK